MQKKMTIKEVAALAKTSKTTVSFYLNKRFESMSEETKERIEKVIKEYNYIPNVSARALSIRKSNLIGVLVWDITHPISSKLVKEMEVIANERGYQIIIGSSNNDATTERTFVEKLIQLGVDGFIIQPTLLFHPLSKVIENSGKKLVLVDNCLNVENTPSVRANNEQSVYSCLKDVLTKNYYDSFVIVHEDVKNSSASAERLKGFDAILQENSIPYQYVIIDKSKCEEEITSTMIKTIRLDKKTFIFVANSWLLPKVCSALHQYKSLIPNTLGILGYDNIEWTKFVSPKISTIVQPVRQVGKLAAVKVIDLIENIEVIHTDSIDCSVEWEESVVFKMK